MKITCSKCGTAYQVDEGRIPPNGLNMKCTQCHGPIQVKPPQADLDAGWELDLDGEGPPPDARYFLRRRTGKVFGPFLVQAIASMLEQGKLSGDEDVSLDGTNWMSMANVPTLAMHAKPTGGPPPLEDDGVDLPMPKRPSLGLVDLPAPKGAIVPPAPAPPAPAPPAPAPGGFDLEGFNQAPGELDLTDGHVDLPAPKGAIVPPPPPPGFSAAPTEHADLPMPKEGISDLPAPKRPSGDQPKIGLEYGQLDLGGDDIAELPVPKEGISDLPAPKGALSSSDSILDLPVPKGGTSNLPAPKGGTSNLPTPKGAPDLGFDATVPELDDLPVSAEKSTGLALESDFDLPVPKEQPLDLSEPLDQSDLVTPKLDEPPVDVDGLAPKPGQEEDGAEISHFAPPIETPPVDLQAVDPRDPRVDAPLLHGVATDGLEDEVIVRPSLFKRRLVMGGVGVVSFILVVGIALGLLTDYGFFGGRLISGSYSAAKKGEGLLKSGARVLAEDTFKSYERAAASFEEASKKLPEDIRPAAMRLQALCCILIRFGASLSVRSQAKDLAQQLSAAVEEPSLDVEKARGLWAYASGKLPEAVTLLKNASQQEPGDAQAAVYLGWVERSSGKLKEAKTTLARALSAESNHAAALFALAQIDHQLKNPGALGWLDKTLQASPKHPGALLLKTRILFEDGKRDLAMNTLRTALSARGLASRNEVSQIHTQVGESHRLEGRNNDARNEYMRALKLDPRNVMAHIGVGQLSLRARKAKEAQQSFSQAMAMVPTSFNAAMGMAQAHIMLREPLKAQKVLHKIRPHHPDSPMIPFLLGSVEASVNNTAAAEENFKAAIKQKPTFFEPYLHLSRLYTKQKKTKEALEVLDQAGAHLPGSPLVRSAQGAVHLDEGNFDEAQRKFEEALRLDPSFNNAHFNLATTLMMKGQLDVAKAKYLTLFKKDPDYAGLAEKMGELFIRLKDHKEAALSFDRALKVDSPDLSTRLAAAHAYILAGQHDKALLQTELILKADPTRSRARGLRARARLGQGKLDAALVEIQQAVERERRTDFLVTMGEIYEARKQQPDALDAYAAALKQDPNLVEIRYRRAVILTKAGSVKDGLRELKKVLKARPSMASAHLYKGLALAESGKEARALRAYRTAVAKDPTLAEAHFHIGQILFDTRKMGGALAALRLATQHSKSEKWRPDAYYLLGSAAMTEKRKKQAIDAFRRYLEIAPRGAALRKDARKKLRELE